MPQHCWKKVRAGQAELPGARGGSWPALWWGSKCKVCGDMGWGTYLLSHHCFKLLKHLGIITIEELKEVQSPLCRGWMGSFSVPVAKARAEIILQLIRLLRGCSYYSSPVISLGFQTALGILDWFCENCALLGLLVCGWVRQCLPNGSAAETARFPAETISSSLQKPWPAACSSSAWQPAEIMPCSLLCCCSQALAACLLLPARSNGLWPQDLLLQSLCSSCQCLGHCHFATLASLQCILLTYLHVYAGASTAESPWGRRIPPAEAERPWLGCWEAAAWLGCKRGLPLQGVRLLLFASCKLKAWGCSREMHCSLCQARFCRSHLWFQGRGSWDAYSHFSGRQTSSPPQNPPWKVYPSTVPCSIGHACSQLFPDIHGPDCLWLLHSSSSSRASGGQICQLHISSPSSGGYSATSTFCYQQWCIHPAEREEIQEHYTKRYWSNGPLGPPRPQCHIEKYVQLALYIYIYIN